MNDFENNRFGAGVPLHLPQAQVRAIRPPSSRLDWVIGLVAPLCLFFEPGNNFRLASSVIGEETLAVPLSLMILPLIIGLTMMRWKNAVAYSRAVAFLAVLFVFYCLLMAGVSAAIVDSMAILYGMQWIVMFLWMPYFLTLSDVRSRNGFLGGFLVGTTINVIYYVVSAALEMLTYGALLDGGRMTQNLILPGQYQIAVYVPSAVAYSISIVNALHASGQKRLSLKFLVPLNVGAFLCLIAFAAREALLVYTAATVLILSFRDVQRAVVSGFAVVLAGLALLANAAVLTDLALATDLRALHKVVEVQGTSGRDMMIAEVLQVIEHNPVFGSAFIPPNTQRVGLAVDAPSAHNMYVDAFAWTGMLGGIVFVAFALVLLVGAISAILNSFQRDPRARPVYRYAGVLVLLLLVVSNNINVPMRQPVVAPIFAFIIFLLDLRKMPTLRNKSS